MEAVLVPQSGEERVGWPGRLRILDLGVQHWDPQNGSLEEAHLFERLVDPVEEFGRFGCAFETAAMRWKGRKGPRTWFRFSKTPKMHSVVQKSHTE